MIAAIVADGPQGNCQLSVDPRTNTVVLLAPPLFHDAVSSLVGGIQKLSNTNKKQNVIEPNPPESATEKAEPEPQSTSSTRMYQGKPLDYWLGVLRHEKDLKTWTSSVAAVGSLATPETIPQIRESVVELIVNHEISWGWIHQLNYFVTNIGVDKDQWSRLANTAETSEPNYRAGVISFLFKATWSSDSATEKIARLQNAFELSKQLLSESSVKPGDTIAMQIGKELEWGLLVHVPDLGESSEFKSLRSSIEAFLLGSEKLGAYFWLSKQELSALQADAAGPAAAQPLKIRLTMESALRQLSRTSAPLWKSSRQSP